MLIGPHPGRSVPDVPASSPSYLGDAVRAGRAASRWASSPCRCRAPGVWVEFEQGDPDYPIWVGCFWGTAAEMPPLANTAPPPTPRSPCRRRCKNGIVDQPTAWAHRRRRHHDPERDRARPSSVNDVGITITNGKGAPISMAGPTRRHQRRRADDHLRACQDRMLHLGATVTLLARRAGDADGAEPAGDGRGQPVAHAERALFGRRLHPSAAAGGERPLRHGEFPRRHVRVLARPAAAASRAPSICTPTGTPLMPMVAQPRVIAT